MDINQLYRSAVLGVAGNSKVEQLVRERAWGVAQRFVAGETLDSAVQAVEELAKQGVHGIMDLLGEMVTSPEQAHTFTENILNIFTAMHGKNLPIYVSIKLSQIGQDITQNGENLGMRNARRILQKAKELGGFVRLDMEDHPRTDITLQQFRTLHSEFGNQVGTVLQSYLYRSEHDRSNLDDLKPNLRFVKGAYLEPATVAHPEKKEVDFYYRKLVYTHLKQGNYTCVATHDESIIRDVKLFTEVNNIPKNLFEFQMLYGIRRDLQASLAKEGYTVRAYIPYGKDWYAYFSRRIAERPQNIAFVLQGLLKG